MSFRIKFLSCALVLLALLLPPVSTQAQGYSVGVTATPNPVVVSNGITYRIFVTNQSAFALEAVFVTNTVSSSVTLSNSAINNANQLGISDVFVDGPDIIFRFSLLPMNVIADLTLVIAPQETGEFTNSISVAAFNFLPITTNVVTTVIAPKTDLAIGVTNASTVVFTNELTTYGLFVTNLGLGTASGVVVTNPLPASLVLQNVSPANAATNLVGTNLIWTIGNLASGVRTQLLVTVRPTNSGAFNLAASVFSSSDDTNAANNSATSTLNVTGIIDANLGINVITQHVSRQTGLLEMWVEVTNNDATAVPAFRLVATNLPANATLYNAVGTNAVGTATGPFVAYNSSLAPGADVTLLLEFYVVPRGTLPGYVPAYVALTDPAVIPTPGSTNSSPVTITNMLSAGMLIEFPATIGKTYTIFYATNGNFSNALQAQPSLVAPATRVQWIDSGPPKTVRHPTNDPVRFYWVQEAP